MNAPASDVCRCRVEIIGSAGDGAISAPPVGWPYSNQVPIGVPDRSIVARCAVRAEQGRFEALTSGSADRRASVIDIFMTSVSVA